VTGQGIRQARGSGKPGGPSGQWVRQARGSGRQGFPAGQSFRQVRGSGRPGGLAGQVVRLARGSGRAGGPSGQGIRQVRVSGRPGGQIRLWPQCVGRFVRYHPVTVTVTSILLQNIDIYQQVYMVLPRRPTPTDIIC
jgi:hypothetical protein